jgi:threonine aldolase
MSDATPIDLRSDTVTKPDAEMRRAMAEAEVGDDVFREDPTVRALEEAAAELLGRQAALFLPSGTMANQVALHLLGRPGGEVIAEAACHLFHYEMGAMAALSGLFPRPVVGEGGLLAPGAVAAAIRPAADYLPRTVLLAVENTHNMAGGVVCPPARLRELLAVALASGLPAHLDGARLPNAAVALGTTPAALADGFTTVMVSLSKGLGCPVGSVLAGDRDLIGEARRVRKMLGGGMRQAGILAAAGLLALRRGFAHLAEDHANARLLAGALAELPGIELDTERVQTNILVFRVGAGARPGEPGEGGAPAASFLAAAREAGVWGVPVGGDRVRFVTHRDAPRERVAEAISRLQKRFAR